MKKTLVFIVGCLVATCAFAQFEIKGLKLNMTRSEFNDRFSQDFAYGLLYQKMADRPSGVEVMTLGGTIPSVDIKWSNDRIVNIYFSFEEIHFDDVLAAVRSKYKMTCNNSTVQNLFSARFFQTECFATKGKQTMLLTRRTGRIDRSSLFLDLEQPTPPKKKHDI